MVRRRHRSKALHRWRRGLALSLVAVVTFAATAARLPAQAAAGQAATPAQTDQAAAIVAMTRETMERDHLRAVIVRVTVDGRDVVTAALGESMTGVPATADMHFRNGAVAISYVSTLLLRLVDQGVVRLDDPLSLWMPELPDSEMVTLKMLANMTAGYPDYVPVEGFGRALMRDPFRQWTPEELIAISLAQPRLFAPGTNWDYSHADYVILGLALERATGRRMEELLREQVLNPLSLTNTVSLSTAEIPRPTLHAFSSERREALGIPPGSPFYEESTFWNPSWTITRGAIQTTDIRDMATSFAAIGEGRLLSPASHQAQVGPNLVGFGAPLAGCRTCHTMAESYNYGLGIWRSGNWLLQNPLFYGYAGAVGHLPSKKITVAVAVTFGEKAFDDEGGYHNSADALMRAIGASLAPEDPPAPLRR